MFTSTELESVDLSGIGKIMTVDLSIFKDSVSATEWLLSDKNQIGGHVNDNFDSSQGDIYSNLRKLESLNLYINAYNNEICQNNKEKIKKYLGDTQFWCPGRQQISQMILFLDGINMLAQEYLSKYPE
ncbi:MAG: hypothetical protein WAM14_12950 [Candidatus Nitrosopolaris sp.]